MRSILILDTELRQQRHLDCVGIFVTGAAGGEGGAGLVAAGDRLLTELPVPGLRPDQLLLDLLPPGEDLGHHLLILLQVVRVQLIPLARVVSHVVQKRRVVFLLVNEFMTMSIFITRAGFFYLSQTYAA